MGITTSDAFPDLAAELTSGEVYFLAPEEAKEVDRLLLTAHLPFQPCNYFMNVQECGGNPANYLNGLAYTAISYALAIFINTPSG